MSEIPNVVADDEALHRRIHPTFVRPDGSVSSQAFTDFELSVDRASYRDVPTTLLGHEGHGVAALLAAMARAQQQEVVAAQELFNPAHALIKGKKTKAVARALARAATWVVEISGGA